MKTNIFVFKRINRNGSYLWPLFSVILFTMMNGPAFGQTSQPFPASGTFTVPANVTKVKVQAWGGGGGGGAGIAFFATGRGGGGGGGAFNSASVSVIAGSGYAVTIGAGGVGGSTFSGGASGGQTIFGSNLLTANGGSGGSNGNLGNGNGGAGGTDADGLGTASYAGGTGATATSSGSGGAGGGAGISSAGSNGSVTAGGTGGTGNPNGLGGSGRTSNNAGGNGVVAGGGGGGGYSSGIGSNSGGGGASGEIIVTWVANNTISAAQSICSGATPSPLIGSTPTGGDGTNYTYLWESSTTSATSGFSAASGTNNTKNYTPGSLTQTTWYRRTVTSWGCENISDAIQILVVPTSLTWDGSSSNNWHTANNWTPAYVPLSCTDVTIPYTGITNFPTISSAATCNNINIASGASLLDNGNLTVSGTATVGRTIATDWYWHFLSSPVSAQPVWNQFSPTPTGSPLTFGASPWYWDFYYYNPNCPSSGLYWVNLRKVNGEYNNATIDQGDSYAGFGAATPNMQVGRGYLVAYGPSYGSTFHNFSGTLNTGTVNISRSNSADVYNLVGNPYPSSIDWKAASGWTRTDLATSGGGYNYWIWNDAGTGNYGLYNSAETDDVGTNSTSRYIAPTQGFFVEAANLGTFTMSMDNNVRVHSTQTWLKNGTTTPGSLRLKLTTSANTYSDEMIVSFNPAFSGTEGSSKFWSWYSEAPELYSYKNSNYYSIDRYAGVTEGLTVYVYAKTGVAGTYTLTSPNVSQFALAQTVILKNVNTGVETNLRENNTVTFTATGYGYVPFQLIFLDPVLNKTSVKDGSWYAADTWSPAGVPVATDDVIILHNVTIDNSPAAVCKTLTIDAPGVLTVATGKELTVNETITNNAGVAAFVIEDGASLLNNTGGVAATVNRFINKNTWHLSSSPVEGETIGDAFPTARKVSRFNEPTRRWVQLPAATVLGAATGYQVDLRASATCTFAGNLNTGDVMKSGLTNSGSGATYNGWNCLGNPYPSALVADAAGWSFTNVDPFAYLWNGYNYLVLALGQTGSELASTYTDGVIPAQQGFFVHVSSKGTGSVTIPQSARVHSSQPYYKGGVTPSGVEALYLEITGNSLTDRAAVYFNNNATEGYDSRYDAVKLEGDEAAPQLYTLAGSEQLAINALPQNTKSEVTLGLKAGEETVHTLTFSGMESFDASTALYLDDLKTGISQNLRSKPVYQFTAAPGDEASRFKLRFAAAGTNISPETALSVFVLDGKLVIDNANNLTGPLEIYNAAGQRLVNTLLQPGRQEFVLPAKGIYIVKAGASATKIVI